jgi:hypothetical protein
MRSSGKIRHDMERENLDINSIMEERGHAVEASLHVISTEELKKLEPVLFPDVTHPWLAPYHRFVEENSGCLFYHGKADDRTHVLYCRQQETGMWFIPGVAVGILQPSALEGMRAIVDLHGA